MESKTRGLGQYFIRMIDEHAEIEDNDFVGQVILFSFGIDAPCTVFCKSKQGGYDLGWCVSNGDEYIHTFSGSEIEEALRKIKFEYLIKVSRREI